MFHLNAKYKLDQSQPEPGPEPWERERVRPAPSGEIEMRIMLEYLGPGGAQLAGQAGDDHKQWFSLVKVLQPSVTPCPLDTKCFNPCHKNATNYLFSNIQCWSNYQENVSVGLILFSTNSSSWILNFYQQNHLDWASQSVIASQTRWEYGIFAPHDSCYNVVVLDKRRNAQHQPTDLVHSRSLTLSEYRAGRAPLARSTERLSMISCVLYCYYW